MSERLRQLLSEASSEALLDYAYRRVDSSDALLHSIRAGAIEVDTLGDAAHVPLQDRFAYDVLKEIYLTRLDQWIRNPSDESLLRRKAALFDLLQCVGVDREFEGTETFQRRRKKDYVQ